MIKAWLCITWHSEYFLQIHLFKTEAHKYMLLLPLPPTSQPTSPFGGLPSQMSESLACRQSMNADVNQLKGNDSVSPFCRNWKAHRDIERRCVGARVCRSSCPGARHQGDGMNVC